MHSGQKDNKRECQPAFTQKKMRGDVTVKIELGSGGQSATGQSLPEKPLSVGAIKKTQK